MAHTIFPFVLISFHFHFFFLIFFLFFSLSLSILSFSMFIALCGANLFVCDRKQITKTDILFRRCIFLTIVSFSFAHSLGLAFSRANSNIRAPCAGPISSSSSSSSSHYYYYYYFITATTTTSAMIIIISYINFSFSYTINKTLCRVHNAPLPKSVHAHFVVSLVSLFVVVLRGLRRTHNIHRHILIQLSFTQTHTHPHSSSSGGAVEVTAAAAAAHDTHSDSYNLKIAG